MGSSRHFPLVVQTPRKPVPILAFLSQKQEPKRRPFDLNTTNKNTICYQGSRRPDLLAIKKPEPCSVVCGRIAQKLLWPIFEDNIQTRLKKYFGKMSKSNDAGHFFQTSAALETTSRKEAKAKNKHGKPIKISSKVLAAHADIFGTAATPTVYIAEAAGEVKRVKLEVSLENIVLS